MVIKKRDTQQNQASKKNRKSSSDSNGSKEVKKNSATYTKRKNETPQYKEPDISANERIKSK
jgi:hypothetical protein